MRVAVICEFSGIVREAFNKRGHSAASFDLLESEQPGEHYIGDIRQYPPEFWKQFDLAICHPPCTHLAVSGAKHFKVKLEKNPMIQEDALAFVQYLMGLPIPQIAVENPVGIISTRIRKPDQIVQPWQFGDSYQKTTCLWLRNLPLLRPTDIVGKGEFVTTPSGKVLPKWYSDNKNASFRSKTFPGIADAMAAQWGIEEAT
jgi:hypothetical protein